MKKTDHLLIIVTFLLLIFGFSTKAKAATPQLMYRFKNLDTTVAQKAVIRQHYIYVVQEVHRNTIIRRAPKPRHGRTVKFSNRSKLTLMNFGHTQSWSYAGRDSWFVGANPQKHGHYYWDTQIAKVTFPKHGHKTYYNQAKLPRLTNLEYATDVNPASRAQIKSAEAAVSPNRKYLLIATLGTDHSGHFALYRLSEANRLLNRAASSSNKEVSINNLHKLAAFHIAKFYGSKVGELDSIQGYAIDNQKTIYVSRQHHPTAQRNYYPREIVKIRWGTTQPEKWHHYDVNNSHWHGKLTELEGLNMSGSHLYLTASYHKHDAHYAVTQSRLYRLPHSIY